MPFGNDEAGLQPGLEVVTAGPLDSENAWSGMEVGAPPHEGKEIDPRKPVLYQGIPSEAEPEPEPKPKPEPKQPLQRPMRKRRRFWFIAGAIIIVVILAAVLGGVLGSRAGRSSGSSLNGKDGGSGSSSPTGKDGGNATAEPPTPTSTAVLKSIRQGSSLSATGWIGPSGANELLLFYQGRDSAFRHSQYDFGSSAWGLPSTFNVSLNAGTQMAAGILLWNGIDTVSSLLFVPSSSVSSY